MVVLTVVSYNMSEYVDIIIVQGGQSRSKVVT